MTPRILLLDLYGGGHHGLYLDVLASYWAAHRLPGHLHAAVSADFAARHAGVAAALGEQPQTTLHVLGDVPEETSLLQRDRLHGRAMQRLAAATDATHAVFLYWDHAQLSTATALRFARPVQLAGVYFRPSFHYGALGGPPLSWPDRLLGVRKRLVLRAALGNPRLQHLFCLDPFVVPSINRMAGRDVAAFLPDPVRVPDVAPAPTVLDAAAPERRKLLVFGVLDHRKGIVPVCRALAALPAAAQARLTLALAGPVEGADAAEVRAALDTLRRDTAVQVLVDDRFVPDAEIQRLIGQADLVLLTYQHHIGSSNVLVRAAAAAVPVLATDYGLVGAQVRRHRLGRSVDATAPHAIARALAAWLDQPASVPFDASEAAAFARANTAEACAAAFWGRLLSSSSTT